MQTLKMVLNTPNGLHMRPAAEIVKLVKHHGVSVRLSGEDHRQADGGSILALLTLGLRPGGPVYAEVEGAGEIQAAARLAEIFSEGGGI